MTKDQVKIEELIKKLEEVKREVLKREKSFHDSFSEKLHPSFRRSAYNLIHYLSIRTFNLHPIQEQLTNLGLSSLCHSGCNVLDNINNILRTLHCILGENCGEYSVEAVDLSSGKRQLEKNTRAVFGPAGRPGSRFMVTMPPEAAWDYKLVEELIVSGMDVARINCSHDNENTWKKIIENICKAEGKCRTTCLIYMDLPGPKLRTGPINPELTEKINKGPAIRLHIGDVLHIYRKELMGDKAKRNELGKILTPARISTSLPEAWENVKIGQRIFFNDGKISGKIKNVYSEWIEVLITGARRGKGNPLRSDKGINLPGTRITRTSLTSADINILPFLCANADMLGYSFVGNAGDLRELQQHFREFNREDLPVILKIETQEAYNNLPELLLEGMRSSGFGVMLARGDLAIEVGFARMVEVQEEIMRLCNAAHVPVVWATQVLENLIKKGLATRAEITDAVMGVRAECVMLNKGPYVKEAMETLVNLEEQMINNGQEKSGALGPLPLAFKFFQQNHFQR